jgi:glycosyltransferase involved in cell wall biosynthesis
MVKTNLLIIINSLSFGGNETAALQLISNIDKNKFNCFILVLKNINGPMSDSFFQIGFPVLSFDTCSMFSFKFTLNYFKLLKKYKIKSTISYVFNYQIVLLQFIGMISGVKKRIIRVSAMPIKKSSNIKLYLIQLMCNVFLTKQIAVSNSVKIWLLSIGGYYSQNITVICNGIKTIPVNNYKIISKLINVVMVARMDKAKDYYTLISAMCIVQKYKPSTNLLLIGDGPERVNLEKFSKKINCRVTFIGFSKNVHNIIKESSIFVHSSFSEGFPNVILEAMINGLPIIASDIPPNIEILNKGEYGMLFDVENAKKLSNLIINLIEDDNLRQSLSIKSFQRSFDYNLNNMVLNYQKVLA